MSAPPASDPAHEGLAVLIVGGTSGLGFSAARALAAAGARIFLVGRSPEKLAEATAALGGEATGLAGDAADPATAPAAVSAAAEAFGRLDALYHVAGGSGRSHGDGALDQITDDGWRFTIDTNLSSVCYSNRAAVRQFLAQGDGGCILNMGSVLARSPAPAFFASHAYAAAKAGIEGLTRSIAAYYAPHGIRANVIAPALVETPMSERASGNPEIMRYIATKQPLDGGRNGQPGDLDAAVLFLLSRHATWATGQTFTVDGGWSVSEGQTGPAPSP